MASVNKVIIVGNLGADPEVRQFPNGGSVTHISVATSERWTDKQTGQPKEQTEWHRISLFNRLGEIAAQYLKKGSSVYIEGSLHTRKWTDQQGIERYSTEIKAQSMQMLGGSGYANQNQDAHAGYHQGYQGNQFGAQAQNFGAQTNFVQNHSSNQNHQGWQDPNSNFAANQAYQNNHQGMPAPTQGHHNQFMSQPPSAPQGQPKAITPPSGIADDDMPF